MSSNDSNFIGERLYSLDFFRGFTMFLLIAEFTSIFSVMVSPEMEGSLIHTIGEQLFHHHPWHGLRFWDLIHPFFMFIVGVAIPYSYANRVKKGHTYNQILKHTIKRSLMLLFIGWALYYKSIDSPFHFQNVLAQLSVIYLLAFLVMNKSVKTQIIFSISLLVVTDLLYRFFPIAGFNHPFMPGENFGAWLDMQYGGESDGHWATFNAIPTTAQTIWGVLAGQLLMSSKKSSQKLKILIIAGLIGVVVGYALDPFVPIIKRIYTSSFAIVSGGWTLLAFAFSYWLIDIKKQKGWSLFFAIVGLNPLFIYLFGHIGGAEFIENVIHPFTMTVFGWAGEWTAGLFTGFIVLYLMWYICYWLYKRKIFIRI